MLEAKSDNEQVEGIIATIASDFERALIAEREFVEWERDHRSATIDEFAERFGRWVDACEPYVRKYHTIEEFHPVFSDRMHVALSSVRLKFMR